MSLATYSDLKTAIGTWRFDEGAVLSPYADDFIDLAEARLNRLLRVREMEASDATLVVSASGQVALPSDYLEWRSVTALTSPRRRLGYGSPDWISARYPTIQASLPNHFTIVGANLVALPTTSSFIQLDYYRKIPALSDANTTNWLLTKSPGTYLHACVLEAAIFRGDPEHTTTMAELLKVDIEDLKHEDWGGRWGRSIARVSGPTP